MSCNFSIRYMTYLHKGGSAANRAVPEHAEYGQFPSIATLFIDVSNNQRPRGALEMKSPAEGVAGIAL